ncbi:MAG: MFS transporter [Actinobacteria bacterium]|nr:MFS transporter [Actinomycetota bacterium]
MKRHLASTFRALAIRDYRRFAIGQSISVTGTWMQKLAQAWLVLELTGSPFLLGVTVAIQQTPTLLFTTVGGALADRFRKRTILVWTQIGALLPALALGTVVALDVVAVWMVMVAALTQGMSDAIDKPARLTFVNDIATPDTLTNAVTLNSVIQNSGKVAGPAIAGLLIDAVGISWAFFANAASFVPVILALMMIRPAGPVAAPGRITVTGNPVMTLRYVAARPTLAAALVLMAVSGLLAYNWNVLLPAYFHGVFAGDAKTVGLAFTSMGLGAVLGGLSFAGLLSPRWKPLLINGCVLAALLTLLGLSPSLIVAHVILFALGAVSVTFRATANAMLQLYSDSHMRGRVISLLVLATNGTTPVGGPIIGWICQNAGPRLACAVGGVGTALAAIACHAYLRRGERRGRGIDEPPRTIHDSPVNRCSDGSAAKMASRSSSDSRPI